MQLDKRGLFLSLYHFICCSSNCIRVPYLKSGGMVAKRWRQGILKGEVSLYHWTPVWLVSISLFWKIKTKILCCHTGDSKPVKQEVNGTVILPPLEFPGGGTLMLWRSLSGLMKFYLESWNQVKAFLQRTKNLFHKNYGFVIYGKWINFIVN